jgi:hypothetical protein
MHPPAAFTLTPGSAEPVSDRFGGRIAAASRLSWPLLVCAVTVALCAPFLRSVYYLGLGDEGIVLHAADRMLHGERIYRDFFEFLPPGGFVLTEAWFAVLGISLETAHALAISLIAGISCLTFLSCRRAGGNAPVAAMIAVGWVVFSQSHMTIVSHHWFTTLFSMIVVWATLSGIEARDGGARAASIAGLAGGMAAMVTPTRGALALTGALVGFLQAIRPRRALTLLVIATAVFPLGIVAWLLAQGTLTDAFNDVILFTASRYAGVQWVPFGYGFSAQTLPVLVLFPVLLVLLVASMLLDGPAIWGDRLSRACVTFAIAGFIGCWPRPDIHHLAFSAPLACPLLARCLAVLTARWRMTFRLALIAEALALCLPSGQEFASFWRDAVDAPMIATPRGVIAMPEEIPGGAEMIARIAATPAGDRYMFYPYLPMMPFLTGREHVAAFDLFTPGYTLPAQYEDTCLSTVRDASWIVIDRNWYDPGYLTHMLPGVREPERPERLKLEQALDAGFPLVASAGSLELRRIAAGADETICRGIAGRREAATMR